jgi:ferrous iron transport protein B
MSDPRNSQTPDVGGASSLPERLAAAADTLRVALAGNPNSGKTTIFNGLTGSRQHVGNYAGVTVEEVRGLARHDGEELLVVDLPGTYSLTAYSVEEVVARNFLLDEEPDVVVDIIDAANLERNLYLATQLLELGVPLVLVLNMADVAESRGMDIDTDKLSRLLGVPIVPTVGHKGEGLGDVLEQAVATGRFSKEALERQRRCHYGHDIERHLADLERMLQGHVPDEHRRWYAAKLLEGDSETTRRLRDRCPDIVESLLDRAGKGRGQLQHHLGERAEILMTERRYGFISGACTEAVRHNAQARHELSDRIDFVLTHPILGLPIFAALMYLTFQLTFTVGQWPMRGLEMLFESLALQVSMLWPKGSDSLLKSLLVDGIIGGVGGVVAFLPNILLLFFAIALLEGTGYMARAAFIMDNLMHRIGLHGKSFIPMLIGFGCSVPAILATRTLENRRDRLTTMLVVPLMSCGARIPIYALFIPAFFPVEYRGPMLWMIYFIGIIAAVAAAKLLRATLLRGETTPFVMELPPYRMPTFRSLMVHMWERAWMYVRKAGTLILGISIILWALTAFPRHTELDRQADQARRRATTEAIDALAAKAGADHLPDQPTLLTRAAQARVQLHRSQEQHWPDEPEYRQATRDYESTIAELTSEPGGDKLMAMLEVAQRIGDIHEGFEEELARHDGQDASRIKQVTQRRDRALATLRENRPEAYQAARTWLGTFVEPVRQAREQIRTNLSSRKLRQSYVGHIGRGLEPVLSPMGFDWRIGTALVGAVAAKEVFVSQMGIVFATGSEAEDSGTLRAQLQDQYTQLVGFCVMLFCLLSAPCVGTFAATWRESGSWRWAALQWLGLTGGAFVVTTIVYQIGRMIL